MANYSELLPDILPHVASCPVPTITRAVQVVAQDFFQRSEAHRYDIPSKAITAGDSAITVTLPTETRLVAPLTMYLDDERLTTTNENMLSLDYGNWRSQSGKPQFIMIDDSVANGLVLALPSDADYTLTGRVAVKPTRTATTLDDDLFELYGDALVDGVLHRLMMMVNTEWHNPQMASYYEMQFERAIDEAHNVSNKGNTSRFMTTSYGGI